MSRGASTSTRAAEAGDPSPVPVTPAPVRPAATPTVEAPSPPAPRRVVRDHHRFALVDVTFDGAPVGGATVDVWQEESGASCWSARVLMPSRDVPAQGVIAGRTRDGRLMQGRMALVSTGHAPRGRAPILMEWRGVDVLAPAEVVDPA